MTILEPIKVNNEMVHIDLNDVLDILDTDKNGFYNLVFMDGELWRNIKLKKSVINKFNKIKEKRAQKWEK